MEHTGSRLVVFCQHGIGDPLVAPLMLEYMHKVQATAPDQEVLFFTEEPPDAPVPDGLPARLERSRIQWHPLQYNVSGAQWWQRARNLWRMLAATRDFVRGHRRHQLVGYLSYGGTYALIASLFGLGPLVVVCFEPHSRYMTDLGLWGKHSFRAWFVGLLEQWQIKRCTAAVVPTKAVRDLALAWNPNGRLVLQGITIDVEKALYDPAAREELRERYAFGDSIVLVYVGKFGGIYHSVDQYLRFVAQVMAHDAGVSFLVISHVAEFARIREHALYAEVKARLQLEPPVPPEELHRYLSAADLGVVAIPPTPSQVYRTPVKSAHYWAAGLPLVIPTGVSDDAEIVIQERVGLVVNDLPVDDVPSFVREMRTLLSGDREALRARCLAAARSHRDTSSMVLELQRLFA